MLFKNKRINEDDLNLEKEYNFFINSGNGLELSYTQCEYLDKMEYDDFNNLLGKLLQNSEEIGMLALEYYDKNIYQPGIEKYNIMELRYVNDFTKDAIELMLNTVDESKRKELLVKIGEINSSNTKEISHFSDKMICIASLALNELSNKGYESSKQLRKIISECVESRLTRESFEEKLSIKQLIFYFVDIFKYNLEKKSTKLITLNDYIEEIVENNYKDITELKVVIGTKRYVRKFERSTNQ